MTLDGIETKREPTPMELALLELAKAIDSLGMELREQGRQVAAMRRTVDTMAERDAWTDLYRSDEHALDELRDL